MIKCITNEHLKNASISVPLRPRTPKRKSIFEYSPNTENAYTVNPEMCHRVVSIFFLEEF